MRVKKYVVQSLPDAMQKIKHDLGDEAVIVSTKTYKTRGFLGLFKKQQIEVIAAVDQTNKVQITSAYDRSTHTDLFQTDQAETGLSARLDQNPSKDDKNDKKRKANNVSTQNTSLSTEKLPRGTAGQTEAVVNEIQDMKQLMVQYMMEKNESLPPRVKAIDEKLKVQEVAEDIRSLLISKMLQQENEQGDGATHKEALSDTDFFQESYEQLYHFISDLPLRGETDDARVICLVGPTGVGKTTTIAKLAARYMLNQHKKIGFITTDTYRIAAVDQLKVYADILNIPVQVAYSGEEVKQAYQALQECDLILMDTAGRNYLQQAYIDELSHFIDGHETGESVHVHLVLSMASNLKNNEQIIHNFADFNIRRLILTKADETYASGMIVNLLYKYALPLTYICHGQDVPDDLSVATPEYVTQLIWGEDEHV